MAPVVAALEKSPHFQPLVVNTGQHRELIEQVIHLFGIRVDRDLAVMQPNQSLAPLMARLLERIDTALAELQPDMVLAQGDTSTVFATALTGILSPNSVRPRRGRPANRQPPLAVSRRGQSHSYYAAHDAPLRPHRGRRREPPPRADRRRANHCDGQHRHRRAVYGTLAAAPAGGAAATGRAAARAPSVRITASGRSCSSRATAARTSAPASTRFAMRSPRLPPGSRITSSFTRCT